MVQWRRGGRRAIYGEYHICQVFPGLGCFPLRGKSASSDIDRSVPGRRAGVDLSHTLHARTAYGGGGRAAEAARRAARDAADRGHDEAAGDVLEAAEGASEEGVGAVGAVRRGGGAARLLPARPLLPLRLRSLPGGDNRPLH
uniref:Uncharacterized protein n=1 Tax=Oryza nivara TaxID=4536 RepID=A0A0E0HJR0_ORYNI